MDKIEKLEQYIYDNGINFIDDEKLEKKSMIVKDAKHGYVTIIINGEKIETTAEKLVALTHESTHHKKNLYYYPHMPRAAEGKIEYNININVDVVGELVPISDLSKLMRGGDSRYDIAEVFGVPEDFVDEAIHIYQRKSLLPYWHERRGEHMAVRTLRKARQYYYAEAAEDSPTEKRITYIRARTIRQRRKTDRAQSRRQYDVRSRLRYKDYVKVMKLPEIMNDYEASEELRIPVEFLRYGRRYFRTLGLPVRQGELITDWRNWVY